jgi:threonylcarbamoyladenosine tRNA methylthiotransferase MtaB
MFENTLKLVDEAGLSMLHVFPFSARKGTPAARMPQLSKPLVKERAARLRAHGETVLAARMRALDGTEQMLLVEKSGMGRTSCFAPAYFEGSAVPGTILHAKITGANATSLKAELLQ